MTRISSAKAIGGTVLVIAAAVALAIAIDHRADWLAPGRSSDVAAAPPVSVRPVPAAPAVAQAPQPEKVLPSFDAVRVAPDGRTVLAGRAAPGAEVTVLDHGTVIGKTTANAQGEWVLIPDQPLPPGARALSLESRAPGASEPERSTATVAVIVPPQSPSTATATAPVAVLLPQNGAAAQAMPTAARAGRGVTLDIVEYLAAGPVNFSGRAQPAAQVALFVNDHRLATAAAGPTGQWATQVTAGIPVGRYHLRLAAASADGHPLGTLSLVLRRAEPGEFAAGDYFAVVPGNNLWHVAQRSYGAGVRYVEIYRANPQRISDPNLIYPGQLLALPTKAPAAAAD